VIAGIYDYIKKTSRDSAMLGFLDGPQGVYNGQYCVVSDEMMDQYRNSGGFDMIGSGRHKIEKPQEFAAAMANCIALDLDGLVIIGGDDSNTNGAVLAEYFEANGCKTKVCGAPKTIDGDLKVDPYIPISFGFDTACRTYSELIGNLGQDTLSSQKYYHFVRLMGRAASNIALECALQTRPNVCLISEEVEAKRMTMAQITQEVVDVILDRQAQNKGYGIVLLPEGLIEFVPEFNALIAEINDVLATGVETTEAAVAPLLSESNQAVFSYLPENIKQQLLLDRDPHGNVQVAKIETERLLAQTVAKELEKLRAQGKYSGEFSPQFHSFGYEGRRKAHTQTHIHTHAHACTHIHKYSRLHFTLTSNMHIFTHIKGRSGLPSSFDATYCYVLGQNVGAMLALGLNGLISSVTNLGAPVSEWQCGGVPITMMCHMEKRHGHMKPVIRKALVELEGEPFKAFAAQRADWAHFDLFRSPGPLQFFTDASKVELCITLSLELFKQDERMSIPALEAAKAEQTQGSIIKGKFIHAPFSGQANFSELQKTRQAFVPTKCPAFVGSSACTLGSASQCSRKSNKEQIKTAFPLTSGAPVASIVPASTLSSAVAAPRQIKVGVVFSGRQAPGGHDVISGIFDALAASIPGCSLVGFVGGTEGLVSNQVVSITAEKLATYRGQGGFELLSRSVDFIEVDVYPRVAETLRSNQLDGLVMIGGARTSTTAAYISEYLLANQIATRVVTVPVDMAGSLKNEFVELPVGFDTASKVAGQIAGNNATDGASAKKYYYFMRLMGQEPSHLALEVALSTKPNYTVLAEEVEAQHLTLADIVRSIADMVQARAAKGKNYGTVIVPEGIIDSIPELKLLITELDVIFDGSSSVNLESIRSQLTHWSRALLDSLPDFMQAELLLSRGTDKKLRHSQVETERLIAHFVDIELGYRKKSGLYKGAFSVVCSFIGYQARGSIPSNFDVNYAYNLGFAAVALIQANLTGYLATITNLKAPVGQWAAAGVPLSALLSCKSNGRESVSISKARINLNGPAYQTFLASSSLCAVNDRYENPGPIQFFGPSSLTDSVPNTLLLEEGDYLANILSVEQSLALIGDACRPGCDASMLRIALRNLEAVTQTIDLVQGEPTLKRAARLV